MYSPILNQEAFFKNMLLVKVEYEIDIIAGKIPKASRTRTDLCAAVKWCANFAKCTKCKIKYQKKIFICRLLLLIALKLLNEKRKFKNYFSNR